VSELRTVLRQQFETAWSLAELHLDGLTTEECLWRPAPVGLHVHQMSDGTWAADWPEEESYHVGPPSIAWVTWHLGFWWSKVQDPTVERATVFWPGSADATSDWIVGLHDRWIEVLAAVDLDSPAGWPLRDGPFADVVAWVNVELTKNAAEIGFARFLYAAR
jgi:hypothetical protein